MSVWMVSSSNRSNMPLMTKCEIHTTFYRSMNSSYACMNGEFTQPQKYASHGQMRNSHNLLQHLKKEFNCTSYVPIVKIFQDLLWQLPHGPDPVWPTSQSFEVSESLTIDAPRVTPILEASPYWRQSIISMCLYLNLATLREVGINT